MLYLHRGIWGRGRCHTTRLRWQAYHPHRVYEVVGPIGLESSPQMSSMQRRWHEREMNVLISNSNLIAEEFYS